MMRLQHLRLGITGWLGFDIDLNLRLGPPPENGGGGESSGNDEEEEDGGPTAQSVVLADVVAERVESGEESTVEKGSGRAPRAVEESSSISPAVRSSEGECDMEEESRKEAAGGAKESSGITTAPSRKAGDGYEEEEAVVEVVKKERDEEAKETEGGGAGEGLEEAGRNLSFGNGREGYLDLLLEAVRQVSGGLFGLQAPSGSGGGGEGEQVGEGSWQNARYKAEILAHPLYEHKHRN